MRRPLLRLLAVLSLAAFGAAACDSPTPGTGPGEKPVEEAQIGFALNLSGLPVTTLTVQVTAADIQAPLVFNVPVVNGTATGNITVPAGLARVITVRAYDVNGTLTHEGTSSTNVSPGANVSVTITLVPRAGNVPITINMGSMVMTVARVTAATPGGDLVGDTIRFRATVTHPNGTPVSGAQVRWASVNPAVATVDSTGLVTAKVAGSTEIVATYGGFGASQTLTFVLADGTGGTVDRTAPRLISVNASPDTANMASAPTVDVTFSVTASDAGRGFYAMSVVLQSPDGTRTRECDQNGYPAPGTVTRSCTLTLSRYGPSGRWTVRELTIGDNLGNARYFTAEALAAAGYDNGVTVLNTSTDTQMPELLATEFTPDSITPGSGYSQATIRITASDALSGIERVEVAGRNDEGTFGFGGGGGSIQVGPNTWESYLLVDSQYPPAGVIRLDMVRLTDRAGNVVTITAQELQARGMRATLTVIR